MTPPIGGVISLEAQASNAENGQAVSAAAA